MKVYISGQISGLDTAEARKRFAGAEELLQGMGFDTVNPWDNGLPVDAPWINHMCRDLEMLNECNCIYMMDGWRESRGACIEYDFAIRTGKSVLFESSIIRCQDIVLRVTSAIHEVTGLKLSDYSASGRKMDGFFARMMFAHHCRLEGMTFGDIGRFINRERTSVIRTLNDYGNEFKYNAFFRSMAKRVDEILSR